MATNLDCYDSFPQEMNILISHQTLPSWGTPCGPQWTPHSGPPRWAAHTHPVPSCSLGRHSISSSAAGERRALLDPFQRLSECESSLLWGDYWKKEEKHTRVWTCLLAVFHTWVKGKEKEKKRKRGALECCYWWVCAVCFLLPALAPPSYLLLPVAGYSIEPSPWFVISLFAPAS